MKTCTKCKVEKDEALFNRCKSSKNGVCHKCKECRAEYRKNNKEKINEYHAKYRKNNKEKIKEHKEKYSKKNKEKIKEYKEKYKKNNKEKVKEQHAKYRKNNKEKLKNKNEEYSKNNKEKIRERSRVRSNKCSHDLANPYIVRLIKQGTTLKTKDIPIELIAAKRMQMMINRKLKELRE